MVVWTDVVSVVDEAKQQNVEGGSGRTQPHQRQADAKLCLALQYGDREAREDLVVARRAMRMGMGSSSMSLRVDPAYTDPFPTSLRKVMISEERCSLHCCIAASTSTAARLT